VRLGKKHDFFSLIVCLCLTDWQTLFLENIKIAIELSFFKPIVHFAANRLVQVVPKTLTNQMSNFFPFVVSSAEDDFEFSCSSKGNHAIALNK
jgi:hypothetical protein